MKPDREKVIGRAIISCWAVIIACWAISLFYPQAFVIVVENQRIIKASEIIEENIILLYSLSVISLGSSLFLYWLACIGSRNFNKKIHLCMCLMWVVASALIKIVAPQTGFVLDILITFTSLPIVMGASIFRCILLSILCFLYQCAVLAIRSDAISLHGNNHILTQMIVSVDIYVIYALYYLYFSNGGDINGLIRRVLPRQIQGRIACYAIRKAGRSRSNRQETSRVERRVNRQLTVRKVRSYAIVFGSIGATAYFTSHEIEAFILFIVYISLRWTFPETFHAKSPTNCTIISSILFSVLTAIAVPIQISLVSCVVVALALSYQLYREWDYLNLGEQAITKDAQIQEFEEHFNPEEQARKKLRDAGFNEIYQQIVILYSIQGMTMKEVSEIVGYGEQVCKNYFGKVTKVFPEFKKCSKKS